jgi:phage tail sheath protein FI
LKALPYRRRFANEGSAHMAQLKTPAVYINEIAGFTNSVVEVETAVPAFIGYTEKATQGSRSLKNLPFRISGMSEFLTYFGGAPQTQFDLADNPVFDTSAATPNRSSFVFTEPNAQPIANAEADTYQAHTRHYLYYSLQLFFDNGGGSCFIVSVGSYADAIKRDDLEAGLTALIAEPVPTMIVAPDAMSLSRQDCTALSARILAHCSTLKSRVAILDVFGGETPINADPSPIEAFRNGIGTVGLDYGAAYYPWIETSIVEAEDIDPSFLTPAALTTVVGKLNDYVKSIADPKGQAVLQNFVTHLMPTPAPAPALPAGGGANPPAPGPAPNPAPPATGGGNPPAPGPAPAPAPNPAPAPVAPQPPAVTPQQAHQALLNTVPFYRPLMNALLDQVNLLPPSGAIAGVYARTDFTRGVFKAPAGTSILSAVKPMVAVTDDDQQDLNVPLDGKAINAIRTVPGYGVMVWGARTLNGNSQDTRYVNVRRTLIMLEQSIKAAAQAFMFEPNTATTWVSVESMISNFLTNQWKAGALFGATPAQAFSVGVGLGVTMTADDILDGYLKVLVKVAVVRPAEFILLTFQQTMPTS